MNTVTGRIYLIDDHPAVQQALAGIIEKAEGLTICGTAASGAEALQDVERHGPDVIVTDLSLPDMDGLALIEELRDTLTGVQYIVVSGRERHEIAGDIESAGASRYIDKLDVRTQLVPAIRELLRSASLK